MQVRKRSADPVFVDRTGRRRRLFVAAGAAGGLLLTLASLVLVAGFTGAGPSYLPTLPESAGGQVRGGVSTARPSTASSVNPAPRPEAPDSGTEPTAAPSATGTTQPGVTPSPTRTNQRKVPTHTPVNKPSRRA